VRVRVRVRVRAYVRQTIALYIDINVRWPPILLQMMLWFSALNINFELARPECSGARLQPQYHLLHQLRCIMLHSIYLRSHRERRAHLTSAHWPQN